YASRDDGAQILQVSLAPVPSGVTECPLGQKDGLIGVVHRGPARHQPGRHELVRIDGVSWNGHGTGTPMALVTWPGDGVVRPAIYSYVLLPNSGHAQAIQLEDSSGVVFASLGGSEAYRAGWPAIPNVMLWCFLRPRDLGGSKALRAVDDTVARALVDAAT